MYEICKIPLFVPRIYKTTKIILHISRHSKASPNFRIHNYYLGMHSTILYKKIFNSLKYVQNISKNNKSFCVQGHKLFSVTLITC